MHYPADARSGSRARRKSACFDGVFFIAILGIVLFDCMSWLMRSGIAPGGQGSDDCRTNWLAVSALFDDFVEGVLPVPRGNGEDAIERRLSSRASGVACCDMDD